MVLQVILDDCRPALVALCAAMVALVVVIRVSGCRFDIRRLRQLHHCQRGGVQSLSFILTLPMFVMLVMFIVQVSQLMIGQVVINNAAYGAARSLAAWVPQHVIEIEPDARTDAFGLEPHFQNAIRDTGLRPNSPYGYWYVGGSRTDGFVGGGQQSTENIFKLDFPFRSAVTACATISPSQHLGLELTGRAQDHFLATQDAWQHFVGPAVAGSNASRLYNKYCYSYWNTELWIRFTDANVQYPPGEATRDSRQGPTYNPYWHDLQNEDDKYKWKSYEIGWRDPITVTVRHNLALLPGPGRFLAKHLVRSDAPADLVSHRISQWAGPRRQHNPENDGDSGDTSTPHDPRYNKRVYTTAIWARATIINDGIKSLVPYVHAFDANP
ncbi:MAG TPA: hypothetical protein DCE43_00995 [Planctomycetaceae bacterium]|nr:hypothetical protein [Planctomycetaceae bacterium]